MIHVLSVDDVAGVGCYSDCYMFSDSQSLRLFYDFLALSDSHSLQGTYLIAVNLIVLKSCTWRLKENAAEISSSIRHLNEGITVKQCRRGFFSNGIGSHHVIRR